MDPFWSGFYAGRLGALRRKHQQEVAAMEARLRAEMGLPPRPPDYIVIRPRRRLSRRARRRIVLLTAAVLLVLLVAFLLYTIHYGLVHHYIYPAPTHG